MDQFAAADVAAHDGASDGGAPALREMFDFGTNPGNLRMFMPPDPPGAGSAPRPLVVVLHGCTQTAESYDDGAGWSRLARRHGFAVLYPEQRRANNDGACFSWFRPLDVARTGGEVESIRQMVATAVAGRGLDASRVFVCGLSAGGAMAAALLAAYPDVFAGAASIAGLPVGSATGAGEAYEAMIGGRSRDAHVWGQFVRRAAEGFGGPWPPIAVWHGTADRVVRPINAGELCRQWVDVHGLGGQTPAEDRIGPAERRTWRDAAGRVCVRQYMLPGLGHGAPVADVAPPAPFFLPAGLSSTLQIATDFGLVGAVGSSEIARG